MKLRILLLSLSLAFPAFADEITADQVVLDVREQEEIKDGILKNAQWVPLSLIKQDPKLLDRVIEKYKDKKFIVYCRSGGRAGTVQEMLKQKGVKAENWGGFAELSKKYPWEKPSVCADGQC